MRAVTFTLQNNLKSMTIIWRDLWNECLDLEKTYFAAGVSTWLGTKSDSDSVTVNTKLTKAQYIAGITFIQNVNKFFGNLAVTQGDYLATIANLKYGNAEGAIGVPVAVEAVGDRMKQAALNCLQLFSQSSDNLDYYNENSISLAFSSLSSSIVVFGADMTKDEMVAAAVLLEQWMKFLNNEIVSQADYGSTLSKWIRIEAQ